MVFVCYLKFVIWCLPARKTIMSGWSDILKNSINKYFAKNGQKTFIEELIIANLLQISCLIDIGINPLRIY
jgi:hypothetical protein